jgi:hypothetical protein
MASTLPHGAHLALLDALYPLLKGHSCSLAALGWAGRFTLIVPQGMRHKSQV